MAVQTYLQVVNRVLRKLRETAATTVADNDYTTLIGDFVNEAKREVEDAWNWTSLRTQKTITTAAGTSTYSLTGAGDRFRVLEDPTTQSPAVYNTTDLYQLYPRPASWMRRLYGTSTVSQQDPTWYDFEGQDSSGDPKVIFFSTPNSAKVIEFNLFVPQADLSADTDVLTLNEYPIFLGAYALAVSERGEDGGVPYNEADRAYQKALSDAVAKDAAHSEWDTEWRVN